MANVQVFGCCCSQQLWFKQLPSKTSVRTVWLWPPPPPPPHLSSSDIWSSALFFSVLLCSGLISPALTAPPFPWSSLLFSFLLLFSLTAIKMTALRTARPLDANSKNSFSCPLRSGGRLWRQWLMQNDKLRIWKCCVSVIYLEEHVCWSPTYKICV